ncbi:hypothetical protein [Scandinavium manionii]|uniref:hypothetical protein n=1 Tax=Scandinavium manionii TaxID=2926520 RepID=UPI002166C052|nr:hypothetical protein [Scandinavium manionii]MCS2168711.1 hypothetical protein [Scandinavium manionii]
MNNKIIPLIISGGLFACLSSSFARAENLDFTASVTVEPTSCTIEQLDDGKLRYDFGEVSPLQVMNGNTFHESSFIIKNCWGTLNGFVDLTLISPSSQEVTGDDAGKWITPAAGEGKAVGVAYKTELKWTGKQYRDFPVDHTQTSVETGTDNFPTTVTIMATLIPTVDSQSEMTAGNMDATATIQIAYK